MKKIQYPQIICKISKYSLVWTRVKEQVAIGVSYIFVGVCCVEKKKKIANDFGIFWLYMRLFFILLNSMAILFLAVLIYFKNVYSLVNILCSCVVYWYGCWDVHQVVCSNIVIPSFSLLLIIISISIAYQYFWPYWMWSGDATSEET